MHAMMMYMPQCLLPMYLLPALSVERFLDPTFVRRASDRFESSRPKVQERVTARIRTRIKTIAAMISNRKVFLFADDDSGAVSEGVASRVC